MLVKVHTRIPYRCVSIVPLACSCNNCPCPLCYTQLWGSAELCSSFNKYKYPSCACISYVIPTLSRIQKTITDTCGVLGSLVEPDIWQYRPSARGGAKGCRISWDKNNIRMTILYICTPECSNSSKWWVKLSHDTSSKYWVSRTKMLNQVCTSL